MDNNNIDKIKETLNLLIAAKKNMMQLAARYEGITSKLKEVQDVDLVIDAVGKVRAIAIETADTQALMLQTFAGLGFFVSLLPEDFDPVTAFEGDILEMFDEWKQLNQPSDKFEMKEGKLIYKIKALVSNVDDLHEMSEATLMQLKEKL